MPYVQGIIYASKPMGLNSLVDFKNLLLQLFGKEMIDTKVHSLIIVG
mgnify:CR=1 FL=1